VNKKIPCLLLVVFIFPVLTLNLGYCYTSNATVPFSYNELSSQLYIYSPAKNFTYSDSDIMINASLFIGSHESEPGTHYIPYQDISCVYSIDGSEWQNMSLVSVYIHEPFCSLVNPFWYSTADLNYSATLHGLSEGEHHLQFNIKPDSIHLMIIHNQDYNYSTRYQDYVNFAVKATGEKVPVSSTPSQSPTPSLTPTNTAEPTSSPEPQQPEPFPTTLVIAIIVIIAVVCIGSIVYFKKHKQNTCENSVKGNTL
jgi:hypothetical protein